MDTATLDEFIALNEQLTALAEAGVPLDLGLSRPSSNDPESLKRITGTIVRRVQRGESLAQALEGDEDVPEPYRSLVKMGLRTGDLTAALRESTGAAEAVKRSGFLLEIAFFYPLVICLLAYAGLVCLTLFLVPILEDMYTSMRVEPGRGLETLQAARDTLPYWAPLPPLLFVVGAIMMLRSRRQRSAARISLSGPLRWIPSVSHVLFRERCARFGETLAALLSRDVPLEEAIVTAGEGSGDAKLMRGARQVAALIDAGRFSAESSEATQHFPPLLRWAIWDSAEIGTIRALQIASRTYHDAAHRSADRLQAIAPIVAIVVVGGSVTLLYGLALFVPLVEMLTTISAAPAGA